MDVLGIIDEHLAIRETVGYEVLNEVPIEDMPKVLEFLKIVYNYNRMKQLDLDKAEDKAMSDYLAEEIAKYKDVPVVVANKESEWQRARRLEKMREADERVKERELIEKIVENGTPDGDDENLNPRYIYEGFTYVLSIRDGATRILGVEVPTAQVERHWLMEDLKEKSDPLYKAFIKDNIIKEK